MQERNLSNKLTRAILIEEKNRRFLAEAHANLILEALSKDYKKVEPLLKKLSLIAKFAQEAGVSSLSSAVSGLSIELNQFKKQEKTDDAGAVKQDLLNKITGWFGAKVDTNPFLKGLTLLDALETGFSVLQDVAKNNIEGYDLGGGSISAQVKNDKTLKRIKKILKKAFAPSGVFSAIKSLFGAESRLPYVKNEEEFIEQLITKPNAQQLSSLTTAVVSGPKADDVTSVVKSSVTQTAPGVLIRPAQLLPTSGNPVYDIGQLTRIAAPVIARSSNPAVASVDKSAQKDQSEFFKNFVDSVAAQAQVNRDKVVKILTALFVYNKQKKSSRVASESLDRKVKITLEDITDARVAIHEADSTNMNWLQVLFEATEDRRKTKAVAKSTPQVGSKIYKCVKCKSDTRGDAFCTVCGEKQPPENIDPTASSNKKTASAEKNVSTDLQRAEQLIQSFADKNKETMNLAQSSSLASNIAALSSEDKAKGLNIIKKNIQDSLSVLSSFPEMKQKAELSASSFERLKDSEDFVTLFALLANVNKSVADWRADLVNKTEEEKNALLAQVSNNKKLMSDLQNYNKSQESFVNDLTAQLSQAKSELSQQELDYKELVNKFSKNQDLLQDFIQKLADELKTDPSKLGSEIKKAGGIGDFLDKLKKKYSDEVAAATAAAGISRAPTAAQASDKQSRALEALKKSLKDVVETEILAVLKALPDYMIVESIHRKSSVIKKK